METKIELLLCSKNFEPLIQLFLMLNVKHFRKLIKNGNSFHVSPVTAFSCTHEMEIEYFSKIFRKIVMST